MNMTDEIVWHADGHVVHLELNKAELNVVTVTCPKTGECEHEETSCIVAWFLTRFGLDCHVGVCPPEAEMSIAWALSGDRRDLDAAQVWVISTADDMWQAWSTQQG